jgi:hypothetical protein
VDELQVDKNRGKPVDIVDQSWVSVDGRQVAFLDYSGSVSVRPRDNGYRVVAGLPADPHQALAQLQAYVALPQNGYLVAPPQTSTMAPPHNGYVAPPSQAGSPDLAAVNAGVYELIQTALTKMYLSPEVNTVLFRILGLLPGVVLKPGVEDADGRPALVIARETYNGNEFSDLLLGPTTYGVLGTEYDVATDMTTQDPAGRVISEKAGTVEGWDFVQALQVVNAPGKTS